MEQPLLITSFTPRFERWSESLHGPLPTKVNVVGETVVADYGGKPFLWVDGEPEFRACDRPSLSEAGLGRGVGTLPLAGRYMNYWPLDKRRVDALPEQAARIMEIFTDIAEGAGCPDVFVWSEDDFMFLGRSRRRSTRSIRSTG